MGIVEEVLGKVRGASVVVKSAIVFVKAGVESSSSLSYISFVAVRAG